MTHAELVQVGAKWLRRRCGVVLVEHHGGTIYIPDVIDWKREFSQAIECKVSRADYLADLRKPHHLAGWHIAQQQWLLVPDGQVVSSDELPPSWGLLGFDGRRVYVRKDAPVCDRDAADCSREIRRLYHELRRYQVQGITYRPLLAAPVQEEP